MNSLVEIPHGGAMALHEKVGQGGNGEVWFATHPLHGPVALKLVRPRRETAAGVVLLTERLFREAELTARVRHPNVVRILEHGTTTEGVPYLVSERLDGADLGAVLARHGMVPARVAVAIVDGLLAALEAVHEAGIIHRDVKPDNLVLHAAGGRTTLKLIDFGIASAAAVLGSKLTQTGTVVGTPHYLAPEQATGTELDARADLYAVGVILHELLTGRTPFHGLSLQEFVAALVLRDIPPVTSLRPGLPAPLASLVHRALERNPDARPSSARSFRSELAWAAASSGALGGDLEGLLTGIQHRTRPSAVRPDSDGSMPLRLSLPTSRPRRLAPIEVSGRMSLEMSDESRNGSNDTPIDVTGDTPMEVSDRIELSSDMMIELSSNMLLEVSANTPVEVPGNTPVEIPGDTPVEIPGNMPVEMPGNAPVEMPGNAPVEMPGNAPVEVPDRRAPAEEPGRRAPPVKEPGRRAPPVKEPGRRAPPVKEPGRRGPPVEDPREPEPMEVPPREPLEDPTHEPMQDPPVRTRGSDSTSRPAGRRAAREVIEGSWEAVAHLPPAAPVAHRRVRSETPDRVFAGEGTRAVNPLRQTRALGGEVERPRRVAATTPILLFRRRAPRLDVTPVSTPTPWNGWTARLPLALLALFVAALCIGSAEPAVMGELVSFLDVGPNGGAR